jgi:hypothetical protein
MLWVGSGSVAELERRVVMAERILPWLRVHWEPVAAGGLIALAVLLRVALVHAGWPGTDSDDSTMGLMARHILLKDEHPIFFWGQAYMGTIEAHLGALMFAVFGISLVSLKLALIALYAAFLVVMYLLLATLFSRRWALLGLALLTLGSNATLYLLLNAYGGYLETLFFGALLTLLAAWLSRAYEPSTAPRPGRGRLMAMRLMRTPGPALPRSQPTGAEVAGQALPRRAATLSTAQWRRVWGFAVWGLAGGLAVYSDPLVAPFAALGALALLFVYRREVLGRLGLVACLSFVLGISPWLYYVATAPSRAAAVSFLQHAPQAQTLTQAGNARGPLEIVATHVLGTVVVAIPNMTGGMGLCPLSSNTVWPLDMWSVPSTRTCIAVRGAWGLGVLALMVLALFWELAALHPLLRTPPAKWSVQERRQAARSIGRLIAVAAPASTIVLFAASSASLISPWVFARYLVSLLIALPVLVTMVGERLFSPLLAAHGKSAPGSLSLAREAEPARAQRSGCGPEDERTVEQGRGADQFPLLLWGRGQRVKFLAAALLLLLVVALALGTAGTFGQVAAQRATNRQQADLERVLLARGDTRVYSEFWTCYRSIFLSGERIVCSDLTPQYDLQPARYPAYDTLVRSAPRPVFVFPSFTEQAHDFPTLAAHYGWHYTTTTVDGQWMIFEVAAPFMMPAWAES